MILVASCEEMLELTVVSEKNHNNPKLKVLSTMKKNTVQYLHRDKQIIVQECNENSCSNEANTRGNV